MAKRTEVFFLVDGERLEAQTCLLAPTLKQHLDDSQTAVAYLREDYEHSLKDMTRDILAACQIETRIIPGTRDGHAPWTAPYPQGNKILAAALPRDCDVSVFLDTDIVLARPVDFAAALGSDLIAASVSDYASPQIEDDSWKQFYGQFDLTMPKERVTLRAGRRLEVAPYFNAGVIIFRERDADGHPTGLGQAWLDMAQKFDARQELVNRAYMDQYTLPILARSHGTLVRELDHRLNYNIQAFGGQDIADGDIVHYHNIGVLWAHLGHGQASLELLIQLVGLEGVHRYIDLFHPHIKKRRLKRILEPLEAQMRSAS